MTASTSFVQESDRSALDMVVRVANGKSVPVVRAGNVEAILRGQAQSCAVPLSHVLVVPELDANLLSTHQLARQGFVTVITGLCTLLVAPSGRVLVAHVDKATGAAYFMVRPRHRDPSSAQALVASVTADGAEEVSTSAGLDWRVELWHRRYGHIGLLKLIDLVKAGLLSGKDAPTVGSIKRYLKDRPVCDVCAIANLRAAPYPSHSTSQTRSRLELVHSDLIGPFLGHPSFAWVLTLVDDFTRKTWIYCLPNRTAETLRVTLDAWAEQVEAATSQRLVTLHTDNGKEFVAKELQDWAKARGTAWIWTAPYSSSQNGVAERRNGLLEERMRAMLRAARLPLGFWPYAVQYAAYVLNRTPSNTLKGQLPQEVWSGKPAKLEAIRTFGSLCWTLIYPQQRTEGKLSARGLRGIFLGIGEDRRAWLVFCPSSPSNSLRWSRSVVFDESRTYDQSLALEEPRSVQPREDDSVEMSLVPPKVRARGKRMKGQASAEEPSIPIGTPSDEDLRLQEYEVAGETQVLEPPSAILPPPDEDDPMDLIDWEPTVADLNAELSHDMQLQIRQLGTQWGDDASTPSSIMSLDDPDERASAQHKAPGSVCPLSAAAVLGMAIVWAGSASAQGTTADGLPLEPQNLKQAQARPPAEWTKWQEAMHEEIGSLREMGTWELVEAPPNRNIVGSRWVFKLKTDRDGFAARYKARLVAQGFTQREGIDFSDTFAPVARLATIRLVISIALALDLSLGSIDIKTAYLNGKLYDEVYMQQPPEYDDGTGRVCLLRRAIYGVKQAGRAWFDTLKARLLLAGYEQVGSEPCLFVRFGAGGSVILAVYVDDIVIAARGQEGVAKVKAEFASWYKITDNGGLSHILGMRVDHDPRTRTAKLGQTAYIDFLVRKYKMESETALPTPMTDASRQLGPNLSGQASKSEVHDFAALIGCLLWLAQGTRPDIAFPVGYLARFMSNPSPAHFLAAKRILRYLKGTRTKGLHFTGTEKAAISGWSDSDHATDHSTRRSVSAYIFRVFGNMVTWRSKLQATVSVSSTEAEYIALSEASREAKWLRSVLTELGIKLRRATDILTDNKGAEAISKDPGQHGKTKHIEVHHHLVRKLQEMKEVLVGRVHTDSNPADMLTKVMTREKLSRLGRMVGFGDLGSAEEGVQVGEGSSAEKEKVNASGGSVGNRVPRSLEILPITGEGRGDDH
ncbi:hypothetical protein A4X06_0g6265 [Tilletia controversa]|uniref:Integrase catalytic domain-containing protein n=1 Tax=Tilletia controversa TaxID=13291 RepID=A0A8X7MQH0_9BASI|nr:hypothetical protein CF328_g5429 [Tilletia controversa]KAE8243511.1 hypothetical protein A4X06_0g6265 [Tilletia controversa]